MNILPFMFVTGLFFSTASFLEKNIFESISVNTFFLFREVLIILFILTTSFIAKTDIRKEIKQLNMGLCTKIFIASILTFLGLYSLYYVFKNLDKFNTHISVVLSLSYAMVLILGLLIDLFFLKSKISIINILGILFIILGIGMSLYKK